MARGSDTTRRGQNTSAHTAVVVGAAQGIGDAVARRLAAQPEVARLVLADVRAEALEKLAAELETSVASVEAIRTDVAMGASVDALVAATADATQVALVAGSFQAKPSTDVGREDLAEMVEVNLVGTFMVAQGYAKSMIAGGGGAICAVGSIAARMPRMRQAAYCASKAGMRQALRVLGMEVIDRGVRINFVGPGPTATEMMAALSGDHPNAELWRGSAEALRPPIPVGRVGSPDDVAAAVTFLLSEQSAHIALHDLYVDGGESLGL